MLRLLQVSFWLITGLVSVSAYTADTTKQAESLRIGLTPALLHYQHSINAKWQDYLEQRLRQPVQFVQRDSYRETLDLLAQGQLDFAWICSYPYVKVADKVNLVAVPVHDGQALYHSYLIVPDSDQDTHSIADLKDSVFAYADPLSNTGYLSPRYAIQQLGLNPDRFFKRTFYTWSHRGIIEAVANRLVQGGAVDSYIWDTLAQHEPDITRRTRIVSRSRDFGFPPFVAQGSLDADVFRRVQTILLQMHQTPEGSEILKQLNLDRFQHGSEDMYQGVIDMANALNVTKKN